MPKDSETIKMTRSTPAHPDGPTEADVHPDEVSNYAGGGWTLAEPKEPKQPKEPKEPKQPKEPKEPKE